MESQFPTLHSWLWFRCNSSPLRRRSLPSFYPFASAHSLCPHVLLHGWKTQKHGMQAFILGIFTLSRMHVGEINIRRSSWQKQRDKWEMRTRLMFFTIFYTTLFSGWCYEWYLVSIRRGCIVSVGLESSSWTQTSWHFHTIDVGQAPAGWSWNCILKWITSLFCFLWAFWVYWSIKLTFNSQFRSN